MSGAPTVLNPVLVPALVFFAVVLTSAASAQPGSGGSDFATRCTQPEVVKCVGFDGAADVSGGYGSNRGVFASSDNPSVFPTLDTAVKASGNSSLKFRIPSHSGADTSGSYFTNFSGDLSVQFGANADFYIQWRQRFTPEFLAAEYAGGGGWKQVIIGSGDQPGGVLYFSCTDLEVVTVNGYHRGFAQMYNSCSGSASHGAFDGFEEPFGGSDFKLQNARPAPYCLYSQTHATPSTAFPPAGNCVGYFPNEWMTLQIRIKTGPRVGDEFRNSIVQMWIAREGQPAELAINWGPYSLTAGSAAENQKFGKVWLLPYNTGKNRSVAYPEAFTWYDELIISRARIADPGAEPPPAGDDDTTPPSTPDGLEAEPGAGQVTLTWMASSDDVGVTGYQIFRDGTLVGTSATTTFVDDGLAPSKTYSYRVAAVDAAGNVSVPSASVSASTPPTGDAGRPSVPTGLQATPAPGQVRLGWLASTDDVGVTEYRIFRNGTKVGTSTTTSFVDIGLAPDKTYNYRVSAADAAGHVSARSASVSARTPPSADTTRPSVPSGLRATPEATGITLDWTPSTDDVGVTGYRIFRNGVRVGASTTATFVDIGLAPNTTYTYRVAAFDAARNFSARSVPLDATTAPSAPTDTERPTVPTSLNAVAVSSSQVNLSWLASTDNVGVTGYRVYRCQGSTCTPTAQVATAADTSHGDIGLQPATTYTYRVAAQDAAGNLSVSSASPSATTDASSPPGTSLAALAASLQPGQWAELTTVDITPSLDNLGGASGMLTTYTDDMVWDPTGQQAFVIGADHIAPQGPQFVAYTATDNTWRRLARPSWLSSLVFFHGYDHSAIDQTRRLLYHRPFGQNVVHRYDIARHMWTQLPAPPLENTYQNCCDALEVFPELDGLVWVRGAVGEVWLFRESTQQWSQLGTWPTQDGGTWTFAEYNPVHAVLVFGSGNENSLFKLSSSGQITRLRNPPVSVYDGSGYVGVLSVDPLSGIYLALTPTSRRFYTYDVITDTWQLQASPTKPDLASRGVVATPVNGHGVTLFASCTVGDCHAYVYKHSAGGP